VSFHRRYLSQYSASFFCGPEGRRGFFSSFGVDDGGRSRTVSFPLSAVPRRKFFSPSAPATVGVLPLLLRSFSFFPGRKLAQVFLPLRRKGSSAFLPSSEMSQRSAVLVPSRVELIEELGYRSFFSRKLGFSPFFSLAQAGVLQAVTLPPREGLPPPLLSGLTGRSVGPLFAP